MTPRIYRIEDDGTKTELDMSVFGVEVINELQKARRLPENRKAGARMLSILLMAAVLLGVLGITITLTLAVEKMLSGPKTKVEERTR